MSTEVTKEQSDIIKEVKTEPSKSQLESFAKYLNLPWDNLEDFKNKVKDYEEEFRKHLEEESKKRKPYKKRKTPYTKRKPSKGKLTPTESYLRNVFHTFNRPITESTEDLISQLDFETMESPAFEMLKLHEVWKDMRDRKGKPVRLSTTLKFLEELTKRLFCLNFQFPKRVPGKNIGTKNLDSRYLELLPDLDDMDIEHVDQEEAKFLEHRFELYSLFFTPDEVFGCNNSTPYFGLTDEYSGNKEKEDHLVLEDYLGNECRESFIGDHVRRMIDPFVTETLFPSIIKCDAQAAGSQLDVNTEVPANLPLEQNDVSERDDKDNPGKLDEGQSRENVENEFNINSSFKKALTVFNRSLTLANSKPDITIWVKGLNGEKHRLLLFGLKKQGKLGELAKEYVERLSNKPSSAESANDTTTSGSANDTTDISILVNNTSAGPSSNLSPEIDPHSNDRNKRKASGFQERPNKHRKMLTKPGELLSYLRQTICYGKLSGCNFCILSNGDDFVTFSVSKISGEYSTKSKSNGQKKLFDHWDVTVFERANLKYSIFTIMGSILISQLRFFLDNPPFTSTQLMNYFRTTGSSEIKKYIDITKYMACRYLFFTLMKNEVNVDDINTAEWRELSQLNNLGSALNPLLEKIDDLDEDSLNGFCTKVGSDLKKSAEWITYSQNASRRTLEVHKSSFFKVSKTLQNETWGEKFGATTMKGRYKAETDDSVLKIYDINRMVLSNYLEIEFLDQSTKVANFETILETTFKFWLKEINSYNLLNGKDYIPRLLNSGYMFIKELNLTHLEGTKHLYENYLLNEREVKTDAPFLRMELIKMISLDEMAQIDFKKLKKKAEIDLADMHNVGVIHCDISPKNIFIRKSSDSEYPYEVVFIDFGQSVTLNKKKGKGKDGKREIQSSSDVTEADKRAADFKMLESAIKHYSIKAANYKDIHNIS